MNEGLVDPHVSCKECVFAKYEGKTQTGCTLGRTDIFKEQGCLVEAQDDEKEFFIVNGRICNAYRNKNSDWAKIPLTQTYDINAYSFENRVKAELSLTLDVIVLIESGKATDESLKTTVDSLKAQKLSPAQVLFVNRQADVPFTNVIATLRKIAEGLKWKFTNLLKSMSREASIDEVFPRVLGRYYAVFDAGAVVPETFVYDINAALNERLDRFSVLTPNKAGNGLVVQKLLHAHPHFRGNTPFAVQSENVGEDAFVLKNLIEKARYYALEQQKPYLVSKVEEVCPSLS